jgi:hypothetical protein
MMTIVECCILNELAKEQGNVSYTINDSRTMMEAMRFYRYVLVL